MNVHLPKIDNSNLWDKTYTILKERIVRREFSPNQKLSIPELSEQLGVSRTPVRDALNRLEMDGLVTTVSKVGTFVNAVSAEDVLNIMDTRLMLEFWVISKLFEVPKLEIDAALTRMEIILHQASQLISTESMESYFKEDYNLAFHVEFMKLGRNRKNIDIYIKIMNYRFFTLKSSLTSLDMIMDAQEQHMKIIDAIRNGNTEDIRNVIKMHMDDSKIRLLQKIKESGEMI